MVKRTPLKAVSQKQALLNARWAGMRDYAVWLISEKCPELAVCGICGEPFQVGDTIDPDHIVPRSRGGSYDPENLQLVHRFPCHQQKHGNLPEWSATE